MTVIVTGFPSRIAALQFEWAWQNPHLTLHIPSSIRLTLPSPKKTSRRPKRPQLTITSLLSNLLLLVRVPSFSRWPLELRFFAPDVHKSWLKVTSSPNEGPRESLSVVEDFPPLHISNAEHVESLLSTDGVSIHRADSSEATAAHGITAIPLNYSQQKLHVTKSKSIIDFEREGSCAVCEQSLTHDNGIYAVCPHLGCESVTHLSCLSKHFLDAESQLENRAAIPRNRDEDQTLLPIQGTCPSCGKASKWIEVVKEVTLRMRGQKEVERLLKQRPPKALTASASSKRKRKGAGTVTALAAMALNLSSSDLDGDDDGDGDSDGNEDTPQEELKIGADDYDSGPPRFSLRYPPPTYPDDWLVISSSEDEVGITTATSTKMGTSHTSLGREGNTSRRDLDAVVEDSEWEDVQVLD